MNYTEIKRLIEDYGYGRKRRHPAAQQKADRGNSPMKISLPRLGRAREKKSSDWSVVREAIALGLDGTGVGDETLSHMAALRISTVLACVGVIARGVAQPELTLRRRRPDGGSDEARDHPLFDALNAAPNGWTTSFEMRESWGHHLSLLGNAYAIINKVSLPRANYVELIPVPPNAVSIDLQQDGTLLYSITLKTGETLPRLTQDRVLHIKGPSWDCDEGFRLTHLAGHALGLKRDQDRFASKIFRNGAVPGGILSTDEELDQEQVDRLKSEWNESYQGVQNAMRSAVLWGGLKWTPIATKPVDTQFIEGRRQQIEEICRIFNVMPIMIGVADKTPTYASAEQMFLAHQNYTIGPHLIRLEQALNLRLLTREERTQDGLFFHFDTRSILRTSHADRANYFATMYNIGGINPNEIRELDGMNPYPGGDQYKTPMNMEPAGPGVGGEDTDNDENN